MKRKIVLTIVAGGMLAQSMLNVRTCKKHDLFYQADVKASKSVHHARSSAVFE
jgi:hypothetical protein